MLLLLLQVHVSVGVLHVLVCGAQRRTARGRERDLPEEAGWPSVFSSGSCWGIASRCVGGGLQHPPNTAVCLCVALWRCVFLRMV